MQAENTHSRRSGNGSGISVTDSCGGWWSPHRGRVGPSPTGGNSLGIGGWLGMGLYMLLAAVPMIVTTMDKRRRNWRGRLPRSASSVCSGWCFTGIPGHSGICSA